MKNNFIKKSNVYESRKIIEKNVDSVIVCRGQDSLTETSIVEIRIVFLIDWLVCSPV